MNRHVFLSPRARGESHSSFVWLKAERGLDYAKKWYNRIRTSVESLSSTADMWPEAPEAVWYGSKLRQMIVGRKRRAYRVLYEIRGDVVWVVSIRHCGLDYLTPDDL